METTTQVHKTFVSEPIGEKPVTKLAGIGKTLGSKLEQQGFRRAYQVLGQYLILNKNRNSFESWLKETCGASSRHASDCYNCIDTWYKHNMEA